MISGLARKGSVTVWNNGSIYHRSMLSAAGVEEMLLGVMAGGYRYCSFEFNVGFC